MILRMVLLGLLYFIFGKLTFLFAMPSGYAAMIWPSAGVALAFVLRYGWRVFPGILIGSFFLISRRCFLFKVRGPCCNH